MSYKMKQLEYINLLQFMVPSKNNNRVALSEKS